LAGRQAVERLNLRSIGICPVSLSLCDLSDKILSGLIEEAGLAVDGTSVRPRRADAREGFI